MIWTTSFTKELYEVSGQKLLESFLQTKTAGTMFVGYEGFKDSDLSELVKSDRIVYYDLETDLYLPQWLADNKDVIPKENGGETLPCECKDAGKAPSNNHDKGCHWSWFNRNCYRWFRKVVVLNEAINRYDKTKDLVWIDCDCVFKRNVAISKIREMHDRYDGFYIKGIRRVPECGIVGYNMNRKGKQVFEKLKGFYDSGEFKKWHRWDDSFVYSQAARHFNCRDIGSRRFGGDGHVVQHSQLREYILHNKGEHGRVRGMFN